MICLLRTADIHVVCGKNEAQKWNDDMKQMLLYEGCQPPGTKNLEIIVVSL